MIDDIVTRLRITAQEGCSVTDWTKLSWDIQEAADEIEKLRNKSKYLEAEIARLERLSNG
jgi:cell division protein FtsB